MKELIAKYYLAPLVLLCSLYTYLAIDFPIHDFANYYFGGKFLAEGHFSSWIYFPYQFNNAIASEGHKHIFASYAPNTPFLALVFLPLSFLSIGTAKLIWNVGSVFLFLFTIQKLVRFYKVRPVYVLLVPILFIVPIKNELLFGQVYFILFFLLAETWLAYKKNKKVKSAVMLSLAILLKVFPVLLLLVFLFRKKYRLTAYVCTCSLLLFSLSVFSSNIDVWVYFFENVLPRASSGEISESYVPNYQSVFMFFKSLLVYEPTENPHAFFNYPLLFFALMLALKIKIIAIGYFISRKVKLPLVAFSYWILAMIVLSPYGSTYTFILLLFPFLALAMNKVSDWKKTAGFALIFIICNIPISYISNNHFPFNFVRLFALLIFFGLVVLLVYRSIRMVTVVVVVLVPSIIAVLFKTEEPVHSEYILSKHAPILIHDYTFKNNTLKYSYFDEMGEHTASTALDGTIVQPTQTHQNQVFYNGIQLTFDKSNKQKPIIIDGKTLVYLSDYDRGIGFYTLRKIDLKKNE